MHGHQHPKQLNRRSATLFEVYHTNDIPCVYWREAIPKAEGPLGAEAVVVVVLLVELLIAGVALILHVGWCSRLLVHRLACSVVLLPLVHFGEWSIVSKKSRKERLMIKFTRRNSTGRKRKRE